MSKYKVSVAVDYDDPFHTSALPHAPKETGADRYADSNSGSDVEMPGIGQDSRTEGGMRVPARAERTSPAAKARCNHPAAAEKSVHQCWFSPGAEQDSDDDGLDVVPDMMHLE